ELLTLSRVRNCLAKDVSCAMRGARGQAQTTGVEHLECDSESLTDIAKPVGDGHTHLVEEQGPSVGGFDTHLLFTLAERDARRVCVDDERGDALLRRLADIDGDFCEYGEDVGVAGVRDPDFRPAEQIV